MTKKSTHRTSRGAALVWAALALAVLPSAAGALVIPGLRDLADPVAPGGVIPYRITVTPTASSGTAAVGCFNPPPTCAQQPAVCVGGRCYGGLNDGFACSAPDNTVTLECSGTTWVCRLAFNDGSYCGTGSPPRGDTSLCIQNPTGICASGPNFGLTCDTPHGEFSAQCPPSGTEPTPTGTTVELPILPGTSFLDADNNATSDGDRITWTIPPLAPCGSAGKPRCPQLNARLFVDPLVPEGTLYENLAVATDSSGFLVSPAHRTLVARAQLQALNLSFPTADGRDRLTYVSRFSLRMDETIVPGDEEFRFNMSNDDGTIAEFVVPPGALGKTGASVWTFSGVGAGLRAVRLRELSPGAYAIRLRAAQLSLPEITSLDAIVTLNFGDDTITHPARLVMKRGGRRFVAARSSSTTTIVTPPTTTTSTSSTSTSTSTSTTTSTSTSTSSTSTTSTSTSTSSTSTSTSLTSTSTSLTSTSTSSTSTSTSSTSTSTSSTSTSTSSTSTTLQPTTTSTSTSTSTSSTSTSTSSTSTSSSSTSTSTSSTSTTLQPTTTSTSTSTSTSSTSTSTSSTSTSTSSTSTSTSTSSTSTSTSSTSTSTSSSSTSTSSTSTSTSSTSTSSTTSTTVLPCGGIAPACSGDCPLGQTCTGIDLEPCTCQ